MRTLTRPRKTWLAVRAFAEHGAKVVLTSFNEPELQQAYTELHDAGLPVAAIPCDVSKTKDCQHLIEMTIARHLR